MPSSFSLEKKVDPNQQHNNCKIFVRNLISATISNQRFPQKFSPRLENVLKHFAANNVQELSMPDGWLRCKNKKFEK